MRFGSDRKGSDRRENGWLRAKTVPSRLRVLERARGEEMRMRMRMREIDERLKKGLDSVDQSSLFQILNFLDLNFFDFCVCVCV